MVKEGEKFSLDLKLLYVQDQRTKPKALFSLSNSEKLFILNRIKQLLCYIPDLYS